MDNYDIAISQNNNSIDIYNLETMKAKLVINVLKGKCNHLINLKKDLICSSSSDFTIKIIKLIENNTQFELIQNLNLHKGSVNMTILSKKGNLISCSNDKTIIIWKYENDKYIFNCKLEGYNDFINSIFELNNNDIISLSSDGYLKIWEKVKDKFVCIYTELLEKPLYQNILDLDNFLFISINRTIYLKNLNNIKKTDIISFDYKIISMKKLLNNNIILCLEEKKEQIYLIKEYICLINNKVNLELVGEGKIEDKII